MLHFAKTPEKHRKISEQQGCCVIVYAVLAFRGGEVFSAENHGG